MAIINYSRNQYQPEILYLPLAHGGFIQLQEGAHVYPNHAAYGLKNSKNPVVRNYLNSGSIMVTLDAGDDVPVVNDGTLRTFAPLGDGDYSGFGSKVTYAPMSGNSSQLTTAIESQDTPIVSEELKDELSKLIVTELSKDGDEFRKPRKQKVSEEV